MLTRWDAERLVVAGLGTSLAVFFAGVAAVLATGNTPPTEMWAAGSAVSGGLIGLLVPPPRSKAAAALEQKAKEAAKNATSTDAVQLHAQAAEATPARTTGLAPFVLFAFFIVALIAGVALAAGWIIPQKSFEKQLQDVTTVVIALASASGSALIGLLAPNPTPTGGAGQHPTAE
jgi:hypothetical protein